MSLLNIAKQIVLCYGNEKGVWEWGGAARGDTALLGASRHREGGNGAAGYTTAPAIVDHRA